MLQLFKVWEDITNFVVVWGYYNFLCGLSLCCLTSFLVEFRKILSFSFLLIKWSLQDESKLYIFLELVTKGSLSSLYHKYRLRDSQVSAYTRQILNGLMYLHDRNVVHRWYTWYYYQVFWFLILPFHKFCSSYVPQSRKALIYHIANRISN
jgi:hypothetical protein